MPRIDFLKVRKSYGDQVIVPDFSLAIEPGSFTVVLGPSGCGKSTVLRMLAGLERVTSGRISIDGREVQDVEPSRRGCAMVFQNYALYPHMSVADNIGYGMKLAGLPKAQRRMRISEVAASLGLTDLLNRRPGQLSGGQRQRVAIGRAIARDPKVFLFDEPLSNLDAQLRGDMRIELAAIHRRVGATSLFVTHDQVEAMTLADQIVVMNRGRIEQVGTPGEIYRRPASVFVAQFVGSPAMNLFKAESRDGRVTLGATSDARDITVGRLERALGPVRVGLRPEAVRLAGEGIGATVLGTERHGREIVYHLDTAFGRVTSVQPEREAPFAAGSKVRIALDFSGALAFDEPGGALLRDFLPVAAPAGTRDTHSTLNHATP